MIFNLNEQKVLSDPSGSSVFKGEKDFNDIVVNLPDNIDGHTATELNYVMHFVDSDGGYSTKILTVDSSGEALKATATVSTSITSKAQAFYAYVLMTDDEETVIGKTNGVIVMIHPVPDEENEIIPPADADKIIKGLEEIVKEATETIETATDTIEEATEAISSKQDKLTAGQNITITEENVISASSGSNDYTDLTNKPSINNVTLSGNKTSDDLNLQGKLTAGDNITIENGTISASGGVTSYEDLTDKPTIRYFDTLSHNYVSTPFIGEIWPNDEIVIGKHGNQFNIGVYKSKVFTAEYVTDLYLNSTPRTSCVMSAKAQNIHGLPNFVQPRNNSDVTLIQFAGGRATNGGTDIATRLQILLWFDDSYNTHYAKRMYDSSVPHGFFDWEEIGSGAQIVSGVVNANGTITFTDSDGNSFTTTGSSVIGPQGDDYVLTAQDKSEIADIVLSELPTTQGVLYGNTSN